MISLVTPTYEAHGHAVKFICELYSSITTQTYKEWEWVISDHSLDNSIEDLINSFNDSRIVYFKNTRGRGNSSINMNEGIKRAKHGYIKIIHMDDFFCSNKALEILVNDVIKKNIPWGGFKFNHLNTTVPDGRVILPSMVCMGCPSVSFFKNDGNYFDENLIYINDHDMHNRLFNKYGSPHAIDELCITIRMHDTQVSKTASNIAQSEWEYFYNKNNIQKHE